MLFESPTPFDVRGGGGLKKTFDTINHGSLWHALDDQGGQNFYIRCLQRLYADQTGYVLTDMKSRGFHIGRGSEQGNPISPSLFNATLEQNHAGYQIKVGCQAMGSATGDGAERPINESAICWRYTIGRIF